jgi:secreted trypsin-like serine protease
VQAIVAELFINAKVLQEDTYSLAGIVSASPNDPNEDCSMNAYSIFTDVSKFVIWIQ